MNKTVAEYYQNIIYCQDGHELVTWKAKAWRGMGPHGIKETCAYEDQLLCFVCGKINTQLTNLGPRPPKESDENSRGMVGLEEQATTKERE